MTNSRLINSSKFSTFYEILTLLLQKKKLTLSKLYLFLTTASRLFMQRIVQIFSLLILLLLIFAFETFAQPTVIRGRVIDAETFEPLAFVSIQVNNGPEGCISDIDGKFTIRSAFPVQKLRLTYMGYEPMEFLPADSKDILILMQRIAYELPEIVIKPGINPAHRIIKEAFANRYLNDYEHLPSFSYTSYEKMIFGPESDSIPHIDSISADSSYIRIREFFDKQHLFIMENVVKRNFLFPEDNYNKVIASRVSGFKDPLFVFLISQMQTTTFYKDVLQIMEKNFINPVSQGSTNKYYFEIQDTLIEAFPFDTTYIISYRPLLNSNFDGLQGTISISSNGYAIRNVIATPARDEGLFSVKIQQMYDYIDSTHWFPVQLNTDLIIKNTQIALDSTKKTTLRLMGSGKSYISDIDLNPRLRRNQFGAIEVDVAPDAHLQDEKIWEQYRIDSLTTRDQRTYQFMDSVGKAENFDKLTRRLGALMNGKVTLGYIDLYLDNIFKVNRHEGFRLGVKLSTSDKVSTWFKIGGYTAYGFKDKAWKYGAEGALIFDRFRDFKISAGYYDDVNEAGADPMFSQSRNLLNPEKFREFLVSKMDRTRSIETKASSRILKYLTVGAGFSAYNRVPLYEYNYTTASEGNLDVTSSDFNFIEASITMRYAYREKFVKNSNSAYSLGTNYPVILFSVVHGFNNILNGQYEFNRFDFKVSKSFFIKYFGTSSIQLEAGFIDRDIPYVNLYNTKASYLGFNLYTPGSFATMRMNEFCSDQYASLFLSHNFGRHLFRSKYFKPEPEVVTNIGIGSLRHPENHLNEEIKSYEKGYFESGVVINSILRAGVTDVGIAWFYRYGPYSLPTATENMAWKIAFRFVF